MPHLDVKSMTGTQLHKIFKILKKSWTFCELTTTSMKAMKIEERENEFLPNSTQLLRIGSNSAENLRTKMRRPSIIVVERFSFSEVLGLEFTLQTQISMLFVWYQDTLIETGTSLGS